MLDVEFWVDAFALVAPSSPPYSTRSHRPPLLWFTLHLSLSAMPKRQRGVPRRGRQGRGAQEDRHIPLSAQANGNDFDLEIHEELRRIVKDWEDELSGAFNAAKRTLERRHNY